jgi:hypothetical protein
VGFTPTPSLGELANLERLNFEDLLDGIIPELSDLANGLRLNTEVPSPDLSGAWVTVR